jgi:hypothetical protein
VGALRTVDLLAPVDVLVLGQVGQAVHGSAHHCGRHLHALAHGSGGSKASAKSLQVNNSERLSECMIQ